MQARKFYLDIQSRAFVSAPGSTLPASNTNFTAADVETVELYFVETLDTFGYAFADYSANTVKLAIGNEGNPSSGHFKIADGVGTTSAIAFNASAAQLKTALDALRGGAGLFGAGACSVSGSMPRFIVTVGSDNTGSVSSLAIDDNELAPAANLRFIQRQAATATKPLIFDLVVERQPAVLSATWSALPTAVTASVQTLVEGNSTTSEQHRIDFNIAPYDGTYSLRFPSRTVTVSAVSAGVFTAAAHGFYDGQIVSLSAFSISGSSFSNASYYVTGRTKDAFQIAYVAGGTAITANATSGGTATIDAITTPPIPATADAFTVEQIISLSGINSGGVSQIIVNGVRGKYFILTYANGSSGINFPQVQVVASSLSGAKGLIGTIDCNTMGVRDLISEGENNSLEMEVEVAASGSSTQTYRTTASISSDLITAASQPTPPVTTFNAGFMRVETGITGLTGGGATNLDGLLTANGTYPVGICAFIVIGGVPQIWQLTSGTTTEDAANGIVRPDDYATSTNQKIWLQRM